MTVGYGGLVDRGLADGAGEAGSARIGSPGAGLPAVRAGLASCAGRPAMAVGVRKLLAAPASAGEAMVVDP
jgi:hypothetical protein